MMVLASPSVMSAAPIALVGGFVPMDRAAQIGLGIELRVREHQVDVEMYSGRREVVAAAPVLLGGVVSGLSCMRNGSGDEGQTTIGK